jgi:hypothetical protein
VERPLLKSSLVLHVGYSNGDYSNNMRGRDFFYRVHGGRAVLRIDMSGTLRTRTTEQSEDVDACALVEKYKLLNHIEFDDSVVKKFAMLAKAAPTEWQLELDFADKGSFGYSVTKLEEDDSARFDVCYKWRGIYQSPEARARMASML